MGATPNYSALLASIWGSSFDTGGLPVLIGGSNIIIGNNPPYSATDFLALYPNFGGTPLTPTATLDGTTNVLTDLSSVAGLAVGQLLTANGIPSGAMITAINGNNVTISVNTTIAGTTVLLTVYSALLIPLPVLNAYIFLATSSLMQARYKSTWLLVMGLFIAHYLDLWLQSQSAQPGSTAAQIAGSGLALGIKTAESADGVSASYAVLNDLEGWGTWQLTIYGQQFATIAKSIASGPMLVW